MAKLLASAKAGILLYVQDEEQKIGLTIYTNGIYEAWMEDGHTEYGTIRQTDGEIKLTSVEGEKMAVSEEGELTYTSASDPDKSYEIRFTEDEAKILADNVK